MISEIKKEARNILFKEYKYLVPYATVLMIFNLAVYYFLNYKINLVAALYIPSYTGYRIYAFLFLIFKIIFIPLVICMFYAVIAKRIKGCPLNRSKKVDLVKIIPLILINAIPLCIKLFYEAFSILGKYTETFAALWIISIILVVFSSYKFFLCNYYFVTRNEGVLETIKKSFSVMKGNFWAYVKIKLSFFMWDILIIAISIVVLFILIRLRINTVILGFFSCFGFGLNFYVMPYRYLVEAIFMERLLSGKTGDGSSVS